jgi:glutathionylspermidine synthase
VERISIDPRPDWQQKVEELGLIYHHTPIGPYWNESAYYRFSAKQIKELEAATNAVHELCLQAAQHIIDKKRYAELKIPAAAIPLVEWAWEKEPPAIYGRMDFAWDGVHPPKLLEYNADTPTALLEAAVVQWYWLEERLPKSDQFNSIHERLVAKWKELRHYLPGSPLYFAHVDDQQGEDLMTATYMRDTAAQAELETRGIFIKDIGWDSDRECFVDLDGSMIVSLFKLYPWEWILQEEFGGHALETYKLVTWIEPIWKMLLSNKGILPVLWELFPNHPNLLETHFGDPARMDQYVRKPLFSREGANVLIQDNQGSVETEGTYGQEGFVYQALAEVPAFDGFYPIVGSWVIDGEAGGMGIRESRERVTTNLSSFVPHLFEP